jgi:hypothetical protein
MTRERLDEKLWDYVIMNEKNNNIEDTKRPKTTIQHHNGNKRMKNSKKRRFIHLWMIFVEHLFSLSHIQLYLTNEK